MQVVDNRNNRQENKKNQTTSLIYDQNSMSVIKKITKISNSHQIKIKTKQFNLNYKKEYGTCPQCNWSTIRKKTQIGLKFRNTSPFLKTFNFVVIYAIRYQLKSLKC